MASNARYEWTAMEPLSEVRVYASVVVCNNRIFIVGGCDGIGKPVDNLDMYDPSTNEWTSLKHMHTKRAAPVTSTISNKIVAIGGIGLDQQPVDAVEVYKIEENKWKRLQPFSEPIMGMAHFVKDNKMHIFGGMARDTNPREYYKCLEIEDKEKWQAFPSMPTARYAAKAFFKNNKAYVVGGRQGKIPVDSFEVYDYALRSWTVYPALLSKQLFPCYVMTDKFLISLGGLKQQVKSGFSDACEVYNIEQQEKGEWESKKKWNMPSKRGDFVAVTIDNKVYVTGGLGNQGKPVTSTDSFDPETKKWKRLSDMTVAHSAASYTVDQGNLYIIGGIGAEGPTNACDMYRRQQSD